MARDSYDRPKYDSEGRNKRGRRQIGYKPRTSSPSNAYGGVNAVNALQNRNLPAFSDPNNPGAGMNAQEMGGMARERGMRINRGMNISPTRGVGGPPMDARSFRESIQRGQRGGGGRGGIAAPTTSSESFGRVNPANFGAELEGGLLGTPGVERPSVAPAQVSRAPSDLFSPPAAASPEQNRSRLQDMVNGRKLMQSVTNPSPMFQSSPEAVAAGQPNTVLRGKYGTGSATMLSPGAARPQSTIGGRPSSEFFADAAERQGVDNKFAKTSSMDAKKWREALARKNLTKPTSRPV